MQLQKWFYVIQHDSKGNQEIVAAKMMTEETVMVARLDNDTHQIISTEVAKEKLESVRNKNGEVVFLYGMTLANLERRINRFYR